MTKEKSLCFCFFLFFFFFFLTHTLFVSHGQRKTFFFFFTLSYTLSRGLQHFLLFIFLFHLAFLDYFLKAASFCSLLLLFFFFHITLIGYFLKGGNTLLSPPWLSSSRQQHFALSSLPISFNAATLCSLVLAYLLSENLFFLS